MKKYIPNVFTMLNMLSGLIALNFVFVNDFVYAALFVFLGVFFDFFDGFFARKYKVQSEVGLQLDSLADMITSGVVPGTVIFVLLSQNAQENLVFSASKWFALFPYFGFMLTLAAGYRLAKFNVDTRQTDSFIGVPTPAMSIFIMSLPLIILKSENQLIVNMVQSNWFLIVIVLLFSYLMNSDLSLFALKFKTYDWKKNANKYIYIAISILLLTLLQVLAIPLLIIIYILFSIIINIKEKKTEMMTNEL
jgi:CDP-diacylglycerol--serine O-phosphatidyltransferase